MKKTLEGNSSLPNGTAQSVACESITPRGWVKVTLKYHNVRSSTVSAIACCFTRIKTPLEKAPLESREIRGIICQQISVEIIDDCGQRKPLTDNIVLNALS